MSFRFKLACIIAAAATLAGCATPARHAPAPAPAPAPVHAPAASRPDAGANVPAAPAAEGPALPAANSGRGGYYKDDGPGDHPPPNLSAMPDAELRLDPINKNTAKPYTVFGKTYRPLGENDRYSQDGVASWYGKKFHGQKTSSGELYDMYKMTAAHPLLPIPSYARVTNATSGQSVIVRINDRGPFHSDRIIDLSYTAALKLGILGKGSHQVKVEHILPDEIRSMLAAKPVPAAPPPEIEQLMLGEALPPTPAPAPIAADAAGPFWLQLGAYSSIENALAAKTQFTDSAKLFEQLEVELVGKYQRLYGGPFATRDDAVQAANQMGMRAIVVHR